jgi:LPXTG-motif cell wall-anchored protein
MQRFTVGVIGVLVVSASAAAVAGAAPGPAMVARGIPVCEQVLPAATDGALTLDTPTVQAGTQGLGVLTDFDQWPAGLVGGGSGETFISCTPWNLNGEAEVMANQDAALFLFDVPLGTPPGSYAVSVVFSEGSQQISGDGTLVRLSTTVTVTSDAVPGAQQGPACALTASPATVGQLLGDDEVVPGGSVALTLSGVPGPALDRINEYDQLWFVACLGGAATVIVHDATAPTAFDLAVPTGFPEGLHAVRVFAVLDGQVVWWERMITVGSGPPAIGTVTVVQASCASVTVAGAGWEPTDATVELAVPPSEGGESRADLVAGPVQVMPDELGDVPSTELPFRSPPPDGSYAAVVLVDDIVRAQSSGFELNGCQPTLPATGSQAVPVAALGIALVGLGLLLVRRGPARATARTGH